MLSQEEIAQQLELLAVHRRTLEVYLKQQGEIGHAYSPPALINGIDDARARIARIKQALRAAGVEVSDGPSDAPTQKLRAPTNLMPAQPAPAARGSGLLIGALISVFVLALLGGGAYWWYANRLASASQAESAQPEGAPAGGATPAEETPAGEAPAEQDEVAMLTSQLQGANIELSQTQADAVRGFLQDSGTPYKTLAERVLQVVAGQRFRQTLYLDEIDDRYTQVVGPERYADYDPEQLKAGMLRAWNEHYTDQQVDSYDQIVEPRD